VCVVDKEPVAERSIGQGEVCIEQRRVQTLASEGQQKVAGEARAEGVTVEARDCRKWLCGCRRDVDRGGRSGQCMEDGSGSAEAWASITGWTQRGGRLRQVLQITGVGGEMGCVAGNGLMCCNKRTTNKESTDRGE
jgi:hypothetical protein